MVRIAFLRRLRGLKGPKRSVETVEVLMAVVPAAPPAPAPPAAVLSVACPYCGVLLDPPPDHNRLCPRCRRRIVVRRFEGRTIYLTEAALEVFETERRREIEARGRSGERRRWLQLARLAGVPADRRQRIAAAPLTAVAVEAARTLYLTAAERSVRSARRNKRWDDVSRIRRRQAAALYEEAGGQPPPADEIVALHQDGVAASLRALAAVSREAELVGASCCAACRADNGRIFRIADELRTSRLPHTDCPRGLCSCDWWPALRTPAPKRRRRRTSTVVRAGSATVAHAGSSSADRPKPAAGARAKKG